MTAISEENKTGILPPVFVQLRNVRSRLEECLTQKTRGAGAAAPPLRKLACSCVLDDVVGVSHPPSEFLSSAIVAERGRIEAMPMFGAAAAPDMAIAVPAFSPSIAASASLVSTYPVSSLPTNRLLNRKKSAFLPLRLAKLDPGTFKATLIR